MSGNVARALGEAPGPSFAGKSNSCTEFRSEQACVVFQAGHWVQAQVPGHHS